MLVSTRGGREHPAHPQQGRPPLVIPLPVREVRPVVTLDYDRSTALPCVCCGDRNGPHTLVTLGRWAVDVGARGRRGDTIDRPVCLRCRKRLSMQRVARTHRDVLRELAAR